MDQGQKEYTVHITHDSYRVATMMADMQNKSVSSVLESIIEDMTGSLLGTHRETTLAVHMFEMLNQGKPFDGTVYWLIRPDVMGCGRIPFSIDGDLDSVGSAVVLDGETYTVLEPVNGFRYLSDASGKIYVIRKERIKVGKLVMKNLDQ